MMAGVVAGQARLLPPASAPTIGDAYGGGYYIGDITVPTGADAGTYAVIISDDAGEVVSTQQWKTAATTTAGTTSLVNGAANTLAMMGLLWEIMSIQKTYFVRRFILNALG